MAEGKWKLESDLCRCCLNEGSHKNLAKPNFNITSGETEVYADMLLENIGLNLLPVDGVLSAVTYTICEPCIDQLRGVQYFKKQVQITEEKFWDLYKKNVFRTSASVVVKEEEVENPEPPDYRGDGDNDGINIDDFSDEDTKLNLIEIKAESLKIKGKTKAKPRKRAKMTPTRRKASARKTTDKATGKATGKATLKTYPSAAKVKTIKKEEGDEDEAEDAAEDAEAEDAEPPAKKAKDGVQVKVESWPSLAHYTASTAPEPRKQRASRLKFGLIEARKIPRTGLKEFFCPDCNKLIQTELTPMKHYRIQHRLIWRRTHLIKCKHCSLSFPLVQLDAHCKAAHGDLIPTCGICGFQHRNQCNVNKHQKVVHMKEKNFKCDQCELACFTNSQLRHHQRTHTNERLYKCDFCRKKFKTTGAMNLHRKIHTGEKDKVCPVCAQGFVQKASLNYHMARHHPGTKF